MSSSLKKPKLKSKHGQKKIKNKQQTANSRAKQKIFRRSELIISKCGVEFRWSAHTLTCQRESLRRPTHPQGRVLGDRSDTDTDIIIGYKIPDGLPSGDACLSYPSDIAIKIRRILRLEKPSPLRSWLCLGLHCSPVFASSASWILLKSPGVSCLHSHSQDMQWKRLAPGIDQPNAAKDYSLSKTK